MRKCFLAFFLLVSALLGSASAADFTVTNTNTSGPGSLYQAITDANADATQDRIVFNIPGVGVHVIDVSATPLPTLNYPVLIEGYTQPGSHPNTLAVGDNAVILIQLKGSRSGTEIGFDVRGGNTRIRGLSITNFYFGIRLLGPLGGNVIQGNFIGVDPSGQNAVGNAEGIVVVTDQTTIGGTAPEDRNVISGNGTYGIFMTTGQTALVAGNYIGTDASGTKSVPHDFSEFSTAIKVLGGSASSHVVIGGSDRGAGNVISGNGESIELGESFVAGFQVSHPAHYVTVAGNLIGTTADGKGRLGNGSGIHIVDSDNNTIGGTDPANGNTIAYNTNQGIEVQRILSQYSASSNRLLSNRIYGNGLRGIILHAGQGALVPVPNDPQDSDTGPNNLQNYPILTSASIANGTATITGTLNSTPNTQFTIQFFADSRNLAEPIETYLGSTSVMTDGNGDAAYSANLPISDGNVFINAAATSASGDTSEYYYNSARLVNISTRLKVQTGDNALIGGFILTRSPGFVIVRGLGPSLSINGTPIPGKLEDPTMDLYDGKGVLLGQSDNWRNDNDPKALGSLAPTNDLESVLTRYLQPGAYTVILRGKNGTSGIGLVEAYLRADISYAELANLSTRGLVETGDNVMIGGFIATESTGPTRFVIRALGPSLTSSGISNPLPDPTLELHDGNGAVMAANDNWKDSDEAGIRDTGLAPQNTSESAILTYLYPGAYTAIVRGKGNASGIGLVEVYNLH
jgi:hypothetical protein